MDDSPQHFWGQLPDSLVDRHNPSHVDQIVAIRVLSHELVMGIRELQATRRATLDFTKHNGTLMNAKDILEERLVQEGDSYLPRRITEKHLEHRKATAPGRPHTTAEDLQLAEIERDLRNGSEDEGVSPQAYGDQQSPARSPGEARLP